MSAEFDLYHTGIIVDDLDDAMSTLSAIAGLRWATPRVVSGELQTSEGPLARTSRYTYSVDGPHHIELIEQLDSTAWDQAPGGRRVHHLGFFVDDLEHGMATLESRGMPSEYHMVDDAGRPLGLSFHHHASSGFWFELIDAAACARLMEWWAESVPSDSPPISP